MSILAFPDVRHSLTSERATATHIGMTMFVLTPPQSALVSP
jgi:hypothetical protein